MRCTCHRVAKISKALQKLQIPKRNTDHLNCLQSSYADVCITGNKKLILTVRIALAYIPDFISNRTEAAVEAAAGEYNVATSRLVNPPH